MNRIAIEQLRHIISYSPDTGDFVWLIDRRGVKAGAKASFGTKSIPKMRILGTLYQASSVAWALHTGAWPDGQISHINGNKNDLRISNLKKVRAGDCADLTIDDLRKALSYDPDGGEFRWLVTTRRRRAGDVAGCVNGQSGYVTIQIKNKSYMAHHLAWAYVYGEFPMGMLDHINRVRGDNRIANIRLATPSQNSANRRRRRDASSGFKGVSLCPQTKKWKASIQFNKIYYHIGRFESKQEAADAYRKKALELCGAFACYD